MRTSAPLSLALAALALSACSTAVPLATQPFSVGAEWTEISPAAAIQTRYRYKTVDVDLGVGPKFFFESQVRNEPSIFEYPGRRTISVSIELVTAEGKTFPLRADRVACPGYDGACVAGFSARLPDQLTVKAVRVRSSEPITVRSIRWVEFNPT